MAARVLIIDDEPNIRKTMEMIHRNDGWETASAGGGDAGLELVQRENFDLVYLDLAMPDRDGIDVLNEIRLRRPDQMVVILTGHGSIERAVEAIKLGAFDFLEKDCGKERILLTSRNVLEYLSLARENRMLRDRVAGRQELVGSSSDMVEVIRQIAKVAPTNARVLIRGESGTGKELIAREIHERSKRSRTPFVKVNCAAIPEDLIEAELFGSVKGAYTGSVASREGKFQAANGGTLFLDEVGDMSIRVQTKVLRAIQEGEIERVGSDRTIKVDVRVIAATNKNLENEVAAGRFREDLYFRLNVVPIVAPPLRSHPEDIPLLAKSFMESYCAENGLPRKKLGGGVIELLERYPWPGNVRELRNQVERLVIMSQGNVIQTNDLGADIRLGRPSTYVAGVKPVAAAEPRTEAGARRTEAEAVQHEIESHEPVSLQEAKRRFERAMIRRALERNDWNVTRASDELGLERTNLHKKIKMYGLAKNTET
jgi:two-component system nitrogen regulation response regulator NtrX